MKDLTPDLVTPDLRRLDVAMKDLTPDLPVTPDLVTPDLEKVIKNLLKTPPKPHKPVKDSDKSEPMGKIVRKNQ